MVPNSPKELHSNSANTQKISSDANLHQAIDANIHKTELFQSLLTKTMIFLFKIALLSNLESLHSNVFFIYRLGLFAQKGKSMALFKY